MLNVTEFVARALEDPANGWSMGTFGATGEFVREASEPYEIGVSADIPEIVTARGGLRVVPLDAVHALAYESLSNDGKGWSSTVAFCLPVADAPKPGVIRALGPDDGALRSEDRGAYLFDLGVTVGHVAMCVRTADADLIAALDDLQGKSLLGFDGAFAKALIVEKGPHRVMLSPLGRLEVYALIPSEGSSSPAGPHTHLLPRLIASRRTHSANDPIPPNLQPVLTMHPPSPGLDTFGRNIGYDSEAARRFDLLLATHGIGDAQKIRHEAEDAIRRGVPPEDFAAPTTRLGRTQLRIALRRLARELPSDTLGSWRSFYDARAREDSTPA